MPFPLGRLVSLITRAVGTIASAVPALEAASSVLKTGSGAEKKSAVLALVATELQAAEFATGRDLASDADVIAAAGAVVDAVAALHKVVSRKAGAAALPQ